MPWGGGAGVPWAFLWSYPPIRTGSGAVEILPESPTVGGIDPLGDA